MNEVQKEIKKLMNLKQNKGKDKSSFEETAQKNVWKRQIDIPSKFENADDKKLAISYFDAYLDNYTFQNFTDIQNVGDLVFEEVLKDKVQKEINKIVNDLNSKFVPDKLIQNLHAIETRIWELKEKAGIVGKKEQDDLTALQEKEKKFKLYIAFNRNQFTFWSPINCKQCGSDDVQPILMNRRVDKFEALKHPAFSGRFLFNIEIIDDVEKGLITKEQASRYLHTSEKYITWAIENRYKIIEVDGVDKKDVDSYINDTPHLGKIEDYNK